jgi:hypothetical protein
VTSDMSQLGLTGSSHASCDDPSYGWRGFSIAMKPTHYQITVRGRLSETLIAAFDGLSASASAAGTVLSGEIVDQAALYGLLDRIESLGLELLDVRRVAPAA